MWVTAAPFSANPDDVRPASKARVNNSETAISRNLTPEPLPKKKAKPGARAQGPGDDVTNPNAILLLPGHKTEVTPCSAIEFTICTDALIRSLSVHSIP